MNSKVGFSGKECEYRILKVNSESILAQSQSVLGRPLLPLFIGGQISRIRSGLIQISSYNTSYSMTLTRPIFHGTLPEQASGVPTSWDLVFIPLSVRFLPLMNDPKEVLRDSKANLHRRPPGG
jgi:hypothetical protein